LKRSRGRDCRYKSNFSLSCLVRKCSRMTPSSGIVPASSVPLLHHAATVASGCGIRGAIMSKG
jgi:hypothetical protein